jgi:hypothetical protein
MACVHTVGLENAVRKIGWDMVAEMTMGRTQMRPPALKIPGAKYAKSVIYNCIIRIAPNHTKDKTSNSIKQHKYSKSTPIKNQDGRKKFAL